jgi:hypothetical protein
MKTVFSGSTSEFRTDVRDRLISSRKYYYEAFRRDRSQAWALVQALALSAVLRQWNKNEAVSCDEWQLARILSEQELRGRNPRRLAWAQANLIELYLLAPTINGKTPFSTVKAKEEARKHAEEFRRVTDLTAVEIHSTKRQLLRYPIFFAVVNRELQTIAAHAQVLANLLPESTIYA